MNTCSKNLKRYKKALIRYAVMIFNAQSINNVRYITRAVELFIRTNTMGIRIDTGIANSVIAAVVDDGMRNIMIVQRVI